MACYLQAGSADLDHLECILACLYALFAQLCTSLVFIIEDDIPKALRENMSIYITMQKALIRANTSNIICSRLHQ